MYPECAIASWDVLVFLLDAQKIDCMDAKKKKKTKSSVNANFKRQEKQSQCERYISPTTTLNIPISHYGEMIDLLKQK